MSLPVAATRLDTSMTAASNVEELLVASSGFSQHGFSKGHQSRSGTPGRNMDSRGHSPYRQRHNDTWSTGKDNNYNSFKNGQWVQRKFSSSPGRRNETSVKGQSNKEKPKIKVEEICLLGVLFGRLVVVGIEKCPDHQAGLSRDLGISVRGPCLPEEGVV